MCSLCKGDLCAPAQVRLALTPTRFLFWREYVICIHTFLGLHDPCVCDLASCHTVSDLQTALVTLPRPAPGGLGPAAARLLEDSKAPATLRAYGRAWRTFCSWCEASGREALPASPATVGDYVAARCTVCKVATLQLDLAAISKAHALLGLPNPARSGLVRELMQGLRRRKGVRPARKAAATTEILRRLVGDHEEAGRHRVRSAIAHLVGPAVRPVDDIEQAAAHDHRPGRLGDLPQDLLVDLVATLHPPVEGLAAAAEAERGAGVGPGHEPVQGHGDVGNDLRHVVTT